MTAFDVLVAVVVAYAIYFIPLTVLLLKGKGWMALLFAFVPVVGYISLVSLFRLAKPHSWWARHRYGVYERQEARGRYPGAPTEPEEALAWIGWVVVGVLGPGLIVLGVIGLVQDGTLG